MFSENKYEGFDPAIVAVVRGKAGDLARKPEFSPHELEDIEQEFILAVLAGLRHYDSTRSTMKTYIRRLVDRKSLRLVSRRLAEKRAYESGNAGHGSVFFKEKENKSNTSEDYVLHVCLRLDLETVIRLLPVRERQLCLSFKEHSISEVSTLTGIPRSTLYGLLHRLRDHFAEKKMEEYLK